MTGQFTDRARKVLALARYEARRLSHDYIGAEHILLGLIREGEGVAAEVLENFGLRLEDIRQEVIKLVKPGNDKLVSVNPPFAPDAEKAIELAMYEAKAMGHEYVGTEHLLLGLIRAEGIAKDALSQLGLSADKIASMREEIAKFLVSATSSSAGKDAVPEAGRILKEGRDLVNLLNSLQDTLNKQIAEVNGVTKKLTEDFVKLQGKNCEQSEINRIRNLAQDALKHLELHQKLSGEGKIAEAGKELEELRHILNVMIVEDNNIDDIELA